MLKPNMLFTHCVTVAAGLLGSLVCATPFDTAPPPNFVSPLTPANIPAEFPASFSHADENSRPFLRRIIRTRNAHWLVSIKLQGKTMCHGMWMSPTLVLTTASCASAFMTSEDDEQLNHDPSSDLSIHTSDTVVPVELVLNGEITYDTTTDYVSRVLPSTAAANPSNFIDNLFSVCLQ